MPSQAHNRSLAKPKARPRQPQTFWWSLLFSLGFLLICPSLDAQAQLAGTYRCTSASVGKRVGRCSSPPLVLYSDGSYHIWGEQGTYTIRGHWVILSESRKRGPGRLIHGREIIFEYTYRGQKHRIKFLREYATSRGAAFI